MRISYRRLWSIAVTGFNILLILGILICQYNLHRENDANRLLSVRNSEDAAVTELLNNASYLEGRPFPEFIIYHPHDPKGRMTMSQFRERQASMGKEYIFLMHFSEYSCTKCTERELNRVRQMALQGPSHDIWIVGSFEHASKYARWSNLERCSLSVYLDSAATLMEKLPRTPAYYLIDAETGRIVRAFYETDNDQCWEEYFYRYCRSMLAQTIHEGGRVYER